LAYIIKTPQSSKLLIRSNRFTPLYYQNVLISPKDFTRKTPVPAGFPRLIPSDEYLEKSKSMPILILEKTWITPDPRQIAETYFPKTSIICQ